MDASPPPLLHGARPTAPYTARAPSPPALLIPPGNWSTPVKIVPRYDNVDPAFLSAEDLAVITQDGIEQIAYDSAPHWAYESRRVAQPILDFLYLGPSNVIRNRPWLREEGITMVLAIRDARQASMNLMAVDKLAHDLGIEAHSIDVSGSHELTRAFPSTIRIINDHMLRIYRGQAVENSNLKPNAGHAQVEGRGAETGTMAIAEASFRRGKVLVFCETGNNRSAAIVCAYLMAVLGMPAVEACQFVTYKRLCACMDEDLKHTLVAYGDILLAQRTVHHHELEEALSPKRTKRGIGEIVDADGDQLMADIDPHRSSDQDRFVGRVPFTPFVDN
ncbi:protein-tyrosine phosphatase-like protein [Nemania sp. NC0429]|nr:protein-tyrosine phosphatase-like protein [Nemania sp. NC0429]